jgi:hypothetical protein
MPNAENHPSHYSGNAAKLVIVLILGVLLVLSVHQVRQRARMAADEAEAVRSLHHIITALISYYGYYQTVGFAPNLSSLGGRDSRVLNYGTCTDNAIPKSTSACLIDSTLAAGTTDLSMRPIRGRMA